MSDIKAEAYTDGKQHECGFCRKPFEPNVDDPNFFCSDECDRRATEAPNGPHPEWKSLAIQAIQLLWQAQALAAKGEAPYINRLQLDNAIASMNCLDVVAQKRAHTALRGKGAAEADCIKAIATAAEWANEDHLEADARRQELSDMCDAGEIDASTANAIEVGYVDNDSSELDDQRREYIRGQLAPHVERLPGNKELDSLVHDERNAATPGSPRDGAKHSLKIERLEDIAGLLGRDIEDAEDIRKRVTGSIRRASDRHDADIKKRIARLKGQNKSVSPSPRKNGEKE